MSLLYQSIHSFNRHLGGDWQSHNMRALWIFSQDKSLSQFFSYNSSRPHYQHSETPIPNLHQHHQTSTGTAFTLKWEKKWQVNACILFPWKKTHIFTAEDIIFHFLLALKYKQLQFDHFKHLSLTFDQYEWSRLQRPRRTNDYTWPRGHKT